MTSIRRATLADVDALNTLIRVSARELSRVWYAPAQIASLITHVFGVDTQLVSDGSYFVIERDEAALACGGWSARRTLYGGDQAKGESDPRLDPAIDAARIRAFFVHPAAARQGLGQQLLRHCEWEARQAGFTTMEMMATLPGEPFYRANGYEPIERVVLDLPDGERVELVRMGRALT